MESNVADELNEGEIEEVHLTNLEQDDVLRMSFESWAEAYEFYNSYAREMGFSLRTNDVKKRRRADGDFVMKEWACSRQGKRREARIEREDRVREPRDATRCGCHARLRVVLSHDSTQWIVTKFIVAHNHTLTPPEHVRYLKSHRKINDSDRAQILALRDSGIRPAQILEYMQRQAGGRANLGFGPRDLYNALYAYSVEQIVDGDAMRAIGFLDSKKRHDDGCFHEYTIIEEGRLGNLFWCDTMCRYDYSCFKDVLAFDGTYKTNRYKRPLVMLLGVNHHFRTCFFGCAILSDETTSSYTWLLHTFLEAMNNQKPSSVITDNCPAMAAAIKSEMPNAVHRLCEWHLERNCMANLHNDKFSKEFKKFMRMSESEKFDEEWNNLLQRNGLSENMWVREYLYRQRMMWSDAFLLGTFFAEQHTTQRCESMNSHQHRFMGKSLKIHKLVEGFDAEFERLREGEAHADFKSKYGNPVSIGPLAPLEAHVASVFTRAIYKKIKFQMDQSYLVNHVNVTEVGRSRVYLLSRYMKENQIRTVVYNATDETYTCSCKHMESVGYPCRHIIHVLKQRHVERFPDSLILKRWTKMAKDDINLPGANLVPPEMLNMVRYASLSSISNRLSRIASQSVGTFNNIRGCLAKMLDELMQATAQSNNNEGNDNNIRDPLLPQSRRQAGNSGTTRGGMSTPHSQPNDVPRSSEQSGEVPTNAFGPNNRLPLVVTQRKCTICKQPGHTKRTCTRAPTVLGNGDHEISNGGIPHDENSVNAFATQGSQNGSK